MVLSLLTTIGLLFPISAANFAPRPEARLRFHYRITCDSSDKTSFPGLIAEITLGRRNLRAYLFRYQSEQDIELGAPTAGELQSLQVRTLPHPSCRAENLQTELLARESSELSLVERHSPVLGLRVDQLSHPDRDVPLHLGYSKMPRPDGGFSIRYTLIFSNETDNGFLSTSKPKSQSVYGRRTDIEWVYQVDFDSLGNVVRRRYQGGIVFGIGHASHVFHGKFLAGTQHPILYDIARHNVFHDRPYPGQDSRTTMVHLVPDEEMPAPEAREDWMWRHPWSFEVSDRELLRDRWISHTSDEYLYVKLSGEMNGGRIEITGSGMDAKKITLSKLGQDLWGHETWVAFRVDPSGHELRFTPSKPSVRLESLRFFTLTPDADEGFRATEVTSQFRCERGVCRF